MKRRLYIVENRRSEIKTTAKMKRSIIYSNDEKNGSNSNSSSSSDCRTKKRKIIPSLQQQKTLPKLVVFDLDKTLWNCFVYESFPHQRFQKSKVLGEAYAVYTNNRAINNSRKLQLYPDIIKILDDLTMKHIPLGICSSSPSLLHAKNALESLQIYDYFQANLIIVKPSNNGKIDHLKTLLTLYNKYYNVNNSNTTNLKKKLNYKDVLFFDDMWYNVKKVKKEGVHAIKVNPDIGLNFKLYQDSLKQYKERMNSSNIMCNFFTRKKKDDEVAKEAKTN
jgi:magnesium-dependent phosphatase-1